MFLNQKIQYSFFWIQKIIKSKFHFQLILKTLSDLLLIKQNNIVLLKQKS
jgi:hypothetical protein